MHQYFQIFSGVFIQLFDVSHNAAQTSIVISRHKVCLHRTKQGNATFETLGFKEVRKSENNVKIFVKQCFFSLHGFGGACNFSLPLCHISISRQVFQNNGEFIFLCQLTSIQTISFDVLCLHLSFLVVVIKLLWS